VALSVLMRVDEARKPWLKARALERIAAAGLPGGRRTLLMMLVEAYLPLVGPSRDEYEHLLTREEFKMARELGRTREEEGERAAIRRLVEAWFGPLPEAARRRFEELSDDKFQQLSLQLRKANTLADLGLEDPPTVNP
jgi:hypothetical protein